MIKQIRIIVCALTILYSCKAIKKESASANLTKEFKPFLHGTWVESAYLDDVVKTKSPSRSSEKLAYFTEFTIDTTGFSGDSMNVGAVMGNHEGSGFILYFKTGQAPNSLLTTPSGYEDNPPSYELGYVITKNDTALVFYHYDKNKKLLEKTKYKKVPTVDRTQGLQYMVNKELVAGIYKAIDTTGNETTVELTCEGKIKGLPKVKTFEIITDFAADLENSPDQICFEIQTKEQTCYEFKIRNDTISLYNLPKDENDTLFKPGPAVYRWIRQK